MISVYTLLAEINAKRIAALASRNRSDTPLGMCLKLLHSDGLYAYQRERLRDARIDERMQYEEYAAYLEFECNERRPHAERHAYCHVQWMKGWHTKSYCPPWQEFALAKLNEQTSEKVS